MAKIAASKPKNSSDAYNRLFGNEQLGFLISKIQSTVISSGTELEKIINNILKEKGQLVDDLDNFLSARVSEHPGLYAIPKMAIRKSKAIHISTNEPDFVLLKIEPSKKHCYIVELKDGHVFDTKKAAAEKLNLERFETFISKKIEYTTSIHICCFNQTDRKLILAGFKNKFLESEVLNGEDFCQLLRIDYNKIVEVRLKDQKENMDYFVAELLKIPIVKELLVKHLKC